MTSFRFLLRLSAIVFGLLIFTALVCAQSSAGSADSQSSGPKQSAGQRDQVDPLKRPLSEKQKKKNAKALKQEQEKPYVNFMHDVVYIITQEELEAFKQLSNNDERDHFIEDFWARREIGRASCRERV